MTDDPWIVAAAVARATTTYRFMVAFQPGFLHPVHAARMSASLQRLERGPAAVQHHQRRRGTGPALVGRHDHPRRPLHPHRRVPRRVRRGVGRRTRSTTTASSTPCEGGGLPGPLPGQERPEVYFSGSSPAAIEAFGHARRLLPVVARAPRRPGGQVRRSPGGLGSVRADGQVLRSGRTSSPAPPRRRRGTRCASAGSSVDAQAIRARLAAGAGDSVGAARQQSYQQGTLAALRGPDRRPQHLGGHRLPRRLPHRRASSAATSRWPSGSTTWCGSVPTRSSSRACRTSRRPTASARRSCPCSSGPAAREGRRPATPVDAHLVEHADAGVLTSSRS